MTSPYGPLIEKIVNNEKTNFMRLGDVHMEQKKYVSTLNFDSSDVAFTLLLPQCTTKAGIIEQSSKTYTDLLFDSSASDVKELVDLLIAMEEEAAKQLHSRSGEWFEGDSGKMTVQSFEDMFTPVVRYVNRQRNVCVRVHIPASSRGIKQASTGYDCDVYDKGSRNRLLSDIRTDTQILPLVEVKEIRMTSTSINLHLNLVECLIVKDSEAINDVTEQRAPARRIQLASVLASDSVDKAHTEEHTSVEDGNEGEEHQEAHQETPNDQHEETSVATTMDGIVDKAVDNSDGIDNATIAIGTTSSEEAKESGADTSGNGIATNGDEAKRHSTSTSNSDLPLENEGTTILEAESDILEEVGVLAVDEAEPIKLKKPDEVYKDIYKAAITKAKKLRQVALEAYLDAKKIKAKFMLEDIYDSDEDGDEGEDDAELEEVTNLSVQ
jgi:hypothetical protein